LWQILNLICAIANHLQKELVQKDYRGAAVELFVMKCGEEDTIQGCEAHIEKMPVMGAENNLAEQ
jgi:hypothetical protein